MRLLHSALLLGDYGASRAFLTCLLKSSPRRFFVAKTFPSLPTRISVGMDLTLYILAASDSNPFPSKACFQAFAVSLKIGSDSYDPSSNLAKHRGSQILDHDILGKRIAFLEFRRCMACSLWTRNQLAELSPCSPRWIPYFR